MTTPTFRTPEEIAPELGLKKTETRRYAKESGHHTRIGRGKIVLDEDHVKNLTAWLRTRNEAHAEWEAEQENDPFA